MIFFAVAAAVVVVVAVVAVWLRDALPRRFARLGGTAFAAAMLGLPAALLGPPLTRSPTPLHPHALDYVGSASCRPCHEDNHESWRRTYHRTMTQPPSVESVRGAFDGEARAFKGVSVRPTRDGDRFLIEIDGARHPVDRVVGSHEHQVYLSRAPDGRFFTLPLEWNVRHARWITSDASFLAPETDLWQSSRTWNTSCAPCHNTRAVPGRSVEQGRVVWKSEVAELGIACEACHGPGEQHARLNRNPMRRALLALRGEGDPTIANPARLGQEESVRACGRCHGKWWPLGRHRGRWLASGEIHRPGPWGLERYYTLGPARVGAFRDEAQGGWWWPDGTPRASAMEFQGVVASPCYRGGELTCLSCHSMHGADPSDQLVHVDDPATVEREDDRACTQCHRGLAATSALEAHTHHAAASSGSRCVGCHMPYSTWGILKAIRTHRISSPDASLGAVTRIPNGCNDCHVDRPLAWTARRLAEWYGHDEPVLREADRRWSATIVDLLEGHALSRALAATSLGRADSLAAAPAEWRASFLVYALADSYPAVRWAGRNALRNLPGMASVDFDHLAEESARFAIVEEIRRAAAAKARGSSVPSLPLDRSGFADSEVVGDLLSRRSTVRIAIHE